MNEGFTLNNLEKWKFYTRYLFTADSFLEAAWLFLITTALQRRVWYGDIVDGQPLFPNLYITLVGPPAVGKGMAINPVKDLLSELKYVPGYANYEDAPQEQKQKNTRYIFPRGPEDITYECLMSDLAECVSAVKSTNSKVYVHSSLYFTLEELETLFKRGDNTDKIHKILLQLWDCKDARYKTRWRGDFIVKNPCVSVLAATQPERLSVLMSKGILGDGYLSRTILVFEDECRKRAFFLKQPDEEMRKVRWEILNHIKNLSKLFGPITVTKEAEEYLEYWFETEHIKSLKYVPQKLEYYFARKPVHIQKIALAYWFTDNINTQLTVHPFQKAIDFLKRIEVNMIKGISSIGEFSPKIQRIIGFIRKKGNATILDIVDAFQADMPFAEIQEIINQQVFLGSIIIRDGKYHIKDENDK